MTKTEVWTAVEEVLQKYDLLKHPFYQAWSNGELTHKDLSFYGSQYLQHVAAFPTYLTALHARLPEGKTRKSVLANAADEESNGRSHADLWRQFIAGMNERMAADGIADAESSAETLPALDALVESFRQVAREGTPAEALAAFWAYESQVPRISETKMNGLKSHYGADDRACAYFAVHMTADIYHSKVWRSLIQAELDNDPAVGEHVLAGAERSARALWEALDGIEAVRTGAAAVH